MVSRIRCREAGIIIGSMEPGSNNAITDVPGVRAGHCTLISGEGPLVEGKGPVRTGVTVILPHPGNIFVEKVRAAVHIINGFGKSVGLSQLTELGVIETPIVLTNTLSVGTVFNALCCYMLDENPEIGVTTAGTVNPVVGECNDGYLNDIRGRHVSKEHVFQALAQATDGAVTEGNVGAGTGMSCFEWKGGIGTASRKLGGQISHNCLGVLVLANFGQAKDLTVAGIPIGKELAEKYKMTPSPPGSIMVIVATDAPLTDRQLGRVARRCQGGLARAGSVFANGSGDYVIAFSTENKVPHEAKPLENGTFLRDNTNEMASLFRASVEATEEAIMNSLFAAETMTGRDGHIRHGLPTAKVLDILRKRGAL